MKLFAHDSPLMTGIGKLVDYVLLGLLWILACLPVITFGAATTAMLLTAEISLRQGEGRIFKTFWRSFRKEFKQATILWLIQLPVLAILAIDVWMSITLLSGLVRVLFLAVFIIIFSWTQLWFAYLSKFKDNVKTILINSFRISMGDPFKTFLMSLLIAATVVAAVAAFLLMPPLLPLVFGIFILAYTSLLRSLFNRYIPKEDPELPGETG